MLTKEWWTSERFFHLSLAGFLLAAINCFSPMGGFNVFSYSCGLVGAIISQIEMAN